MGGAEFRFGVSLGTGGNDSGLKPHSIFDIGELLGKPEATEYFSYGSTIPTCLLSYPLLAFRRLGSFEMMGDNRKRPVNDNHNFPSITMDQALVLRSSRHKKDNLLADYGIGEAH